MTLLLFQHGLSKQTDESLGWAQLSAVVIPVYLKNLECLCLVLR